jgi:serine protease Do
MNKLARWLTASALVLLLILPPPDARAEATPMDWSGIVSQVLPSVVNISVETIVDKDGGPQRQHAVGTGFIIDPNGTIATNKHVIAGAFRITVTLSDHTQWSAKLIAACKLLDLAIIRINVGYKLPFLTFANSNNARVGDPVMVIGNPLGLGTSVSGGMISALHRDLMNTPIDDYIQTDAAVNHGNSGGPMLDRNGRVLGIATILVTEGANEGSNGLGFAIAGSEADFAIQHLLHPDTGGIGWIGVHLQDVIPPLARAFQLSKPDGLLITQIDPGSPASNAGLQPGDIITDVSDITSSLPVANSREFMIHVIQVPVGTPLELTIDRRGSTRHVSVTVADWPDLRTPDATLSNTREDAAAAQAPDCGLILAPLTAAARRYFHLGTDQGVVVSAVDPTSEAFTSGITSGDVIEQVQNTLVDSPDQVMRLIGQAQGNQRFVALLVARKTSQRWIALYSGNVSSQQPALTSSAQPSNPTQDTAAVRRP